MLHPKLGIKNNMSNYIRWME